MPNSNVTSKTSFWGKSEVDRYGLTPARRETEDEWNHRHVMQTPHHQYELARQRGEVEYDVELVVSR